jgi:excinuclease UvrABC ATPase subunit
VDSKGQTGRFSFNVPGGRYEQCEGHGTIVTEILFLPDGGDKGGEVVCVGTPEEVARHKGSYTGEYLRRALK